MPNIRRWNQLYYASRFRWSNEQVQPSKQDLSIAKKLLLKTSKERHEGRTRVLFKHLAKSLTANRNWMVPSCKQIEIQKRHRNVISRIALVNRSIDERSSQTRQLWYIKGEVGGREGEWWTRRANRDTLSSPHDPLAGSLRSHMANWRLRFCVPNFAGALDWVSIENQQTRI